MLSERRIHDHFAHRVRTKAWGIKPGWKFVSSESESSYFPGESFYNDIAVYPKRAEEFKKLVYKREDEEYDRRAIRSINGEIVEDGRLNRISPPFSLTSTASPSSSDDDNVPQTVADLKSLIQKRRSNSYRVYNKTNFDVPRFPAISGEFYIDKRKAENFESKKTPDANKTPFPVREPIRRSGIVQNRYSPPLKEPTKKPVLQRASFENISSLPKKPVFGRNFTGSLPRKRSDDSDFRGSFRQRVSSEGSISNPRPKKKSHHEEHQKNLSNVSKFLAGKFLKSAASSGETAEHIEPAAVVPPGVLKKPGAERGHRSMKKVAFLENAEFSRGQT